MSSLTALITLNLAYCSRVTDEALQPVSCLPALTSLNLAYCYKVTDKGLRHVSNLPALTFLDLTNLKEVKTLQAVIK